MTQTLYEKYGGQTTIDTLVDKFYEGVLANDTIKHFFDEVDMVKQKKHQAIFVAAALGGPNPYNGKSMRAAHAKMGLTDDHFDAVVDELTEAMDSLGVSEDDIETVIATIEGLRADVLNQ
jgi:hemoglobin